MFLSKAGSLSKQNFMPIVPLAAKIYHWLYEYAFWGYAYQKGEMFAWWKHKHSSWVRISTPQEELILKSPTTHV